MRKGDIYFIEFGKSKDSFSFGKNRSTLIFQTDKLNFAVEEEIYDYFLVMPLSTKKDIVTNEFRFPIKARDELKEDSFIIVNSICFLHKRYFKKKLTQLTESEIKNIEQILKNVFDMEETKLGIKAKF